MERKEEIKVKGEGAENEGGNERKRIKNGFLSFKFPNQ